MLLGIDLSTKGFQAWFRHPRWALAPFYALNEFFPIACADDGLFVLQILLFRWTRTVF